MGTEKQLVTAAIAAAYLTVAGAAFAAQPVNKPVLHGNSCGNNGNGNGNETLVANGDPATLCFKFVPEGEDPSGEPGASCDPLDPATDIDPTCK